MKDVIKELSRCFSNVLNLLGEDVTREGLVDTPHRVAKSMSFLTSGYQKTTKDEVRGALFSTRNDEMIIVKDIELFSLCEHHILPFFGKCHIGYLPDGKALGLSKFARIVDVFARRLQIQENLTEQIAKAIQDATGCKGVGVIIEAQHLCMMMRGVEKQHSSMKTSVMLGKFRTNQATRLEFLSLIKN